MKVDIQQPGLCENYTNNIIGFDEMCLNNGQIKQHWQFLVDALQSLGPEELKLRRRETQRQLLQTGVSFDIHHEQQDHYRQLSLDPLPYIIEAPEWNNIKAGLIQRAHLLNYILKDLYGPRTLLKQGILPAELIFSHHGFLRQCANLNLSHENYLLFYAADIARSEDGNLWVLSDRTQTPTGSGYALENRMIMRRIFPKLFREAKVQRLVSFFRSLRKELSSLSPRDKKSHTVLLSSGSEHESYFEHSYLANYLGYTLAQGSDLTSRDGKIWLKSIDGLKQIDVVFRKIDDIDCDPLELNQNSFIGVPGLLSAVRAGHVNIANPLGSSIIENPAFQAFLPGICRQILGEELIIPCIPSWWCGQNDSLAYVMDNFDQLIIKPVSKQQNINSFVPQELPLEQKEKMRQMIFDNPKLFVAQQRIKYATTPTLIKGKFQPKPTIQRFFLCSEGKEYKVMPGGLSQVISSPSKWKDNAESELISKDIWILATDDEQVDTLWNNIDSLDDYAGIGSLPSRAAENFYWLGRNVERAENFIRLFRSIILKVDEIAEYRNDIDKFCLNKLVLSLNQITGVSTDKFLQLSLTSSQEIDYELALMLMDRGNLGSLHSILNNMINSAYSIKDLLSPDTWRVFSKFEALIENWHKNDLPHDLSETDEELDELITLLAAFSGLVLESTTVDQGWLFLNIGRRLERSVGLINLIESMLAEENSQSIEYTLLQSTLASTETLMTYHRRHRTNIQLSYVLELLLFDSSNPRSLSYQFEHLHHAINKLPKVNQSEELSLAQQKISELVAALLNIDLQNICLTNPETLEKDNLKLFLKDINEQLNITSQSITDSYFNLIVKHQQLS
ncbi:MAG: circularly permuted type 2 ATP-grasp protein [Gammaproteobacteria bacterium]|nr:circularly permuted type 2 ATP-grasp protein [Gammaproteobacteria bacterium]